LNWDINLDAGEDPAVLASGLEARLYGLVTRVNLACGGHAGDEGSMRACLRLARKAGVLVGAHPSYPDRENFGRVALAVPSREVTRFTAHQVGKLAALAEEEGVTLAHVKPHGALYNACAADAVLAEAIAEGVRQVSPGLTLVGLAGSRALAQWQRMGFEVLGEAFADRRYRADGSLVPRSRPGAVLTAAEASDQARGLLASGTVRTEEGTELAVRCDTLCVHGDNPEAEGILRLLRKAPY
jgi:5-oxoprolinase (ATP-hydrolysing) subunit A